MKTDRELLELAAKSAGLDFNPLWFDPGSGLLVWSASIGKFESEDWNPLRDDGDAFRLAVKLRLEVDIRHTGIAVRTPDGRKVLLSAEDEPDLCAATRRAIVRAAAEIGASA